MRPTVAPCFASATARLALTVDLPTPPLPLATGIAWRTWGIRPFLSESWVLDSGKALFLVVSLVEADLTEQVGQTAETAVVFLEIADEGLMLKVRVVPHKFHVLVLGVVLEIGVQAVTPGRPHDVQKPA